MDCGLQGFLKYLRIIGERYNGSWDLALRQKQVEGARVGVGGRENGQGRRDPLPEFLDKFCTRPQLTTRNLVMPLH